MNTLQKQFSDALKREKKFVTTYYTNETVPCLFRKIDDNKNTSNHEQILYSIDSPIQQGQLLVNGDKIYIVINKENVKNDTYYKSTIKECNMTIPINIDGVVKQIPCYSYDLNSAYTIKSNMINLIDGRGELITELIPELSDTSYIDKGFRIMGGYYKVVNVYNLDGIVHLMIERGTMPADTYSLTLTSDTTSYIEGETSQLVALAMINDDIEDTTATITYSSSDETIATVDDNGLVTFNGIGNVTITANWEEKELTKTLGFTVVVDPDAPAYIFNLIFSNPNNEVNMGSSIPRTLTPMLWDNVNSDEVPFTAVWSWELPIGYESYFDIEYEGNLAKIKVKTDSSYELLGMTFKAICTTDDGLYTDSIDICITI